MKGFRGLKVWQKGINLSVFVYQVTNTGLFSKDFGLRDQIRRAAVSIPSNIAEGDELGSDKQSVRHFYIARGSCAEVYTQAVVAYEINYIDSNTFEQLDHYCTELMKMITKLIAARSQAQSLWPKA